VYFFLLRDTYSVLDSTITNSVTLILVYVKRSMEQSSTNRSHFDFSLCKEKFFLQINLCNPNTFNLVPSIIFC